MRNVRIRTMFIRVLHKAKACSNTRHIPAEGFIPLMENWWKLDTKKASNEEKVMKRKREALQMLEEKIRKRQRLPLAVVATVRKICCRRPDMSVDQIVYDHKT